MELGQAMRSTAAVRTFADETVPTATLHAILDDARFAPSGGNQQGWHVTVIRDPTTRRRIGELSDATWRRYLAEQAAGYRAYNPIEPAPDNVEIPEGLPDHPMLAAIETVPEVLLITADLATLAVTDKDIDRPSIIGGASIYPFVHNLLLAARDKGLGGVLTTFLAASEPEVAALVGLPDGHAIAALVGLGVPEHQSRRLSRRPVEAFTTIDRIDGPAFGGG